MPAGVVKHGEEHLWERAKRLARKQVKEGSKSFWKLTNYIFQRLKKG